MQIQENRGLFEVRPYYNAQEMRADPVGDVP
jgi:hypothetical protein